MVDLLFCYVYLYTSSFGFGILYCDICCFGWVVFCCFVFVFVCCLGWVRWFGLFLVFVFCYLVRFMMVLIYVVITLLFAGWLVLVDGF